MKAFFTLIFIPLFIGNIFSQVAIGHTTPDAMLDIVNTFEQQALRITHTGPLDHALLIESNNTSSSATAVFLTNNTLGRGLRLEMNNAATTATGFSVKHNGIGRVANFTLANAIATEQVVRAEQRGLGIGLFVNVNNTTNNEEGILVNHSGTGRGIVSTLSNTINDRFSIAGYTKGSGSGVFGGGIPANGSAGVMGTNKYQTSNGWWWFIKSSNFSGVEGVTENGTAGVSGYVWKPTLADIKNTQGGYFANYYGPFSTTGITNYSFANVAYVDAGGTARKIDGTGAAGTVVKNRSEEPVLMTAIEAPEILFTDYGRGQLTNGSAKISIDPDYTHNIVVDADNQMKVFVQLHGDCKGVYVNNMTASGFEVHELQGGNSNVEFSYQIIANRKNVTENGNTMYFDSRKRFAPGPTAIPVKAGHTSNNPNRP